MCLYNCDTTRGLGVESACVRACGRAWVSETSLWEWVVGRMCAEAVDGAVGEGGDGASSGRGGGWESVSEVRRCYWSWLVR
jgi:hypothetical protein